jgi:anti-sigma regulatory factor (Ser/Thr protein kinase)
MDPIPIPAGDPLETALLSTGGPTFDEQSLAKFTLPSLEGNERIAIDKVIHAVEPLGLERARLDRLKTAVGETVMNAIEHGNEYDPDLEVEVEVTASPSRVKVRVTDAGVDKEIPEAVTPNLEAKLAGEQEARGWGLFLIGQMVDEVNRSRHDGRQVVELIVHREGAM